MRNTRQERVQQLAATTPRVEGELLAPDMPGQLGSESTLVTAIDRFNANRLADQRQEAQLYASVWGGLAAAIVNTPSPSIAEQDRRRLEQVQAELFTTLEVRERRRRQGGRFSDSVFMRSIVAIIGQEAAESVSQKIERFCSRNASSPQLSAAAVSQIITEIARVLESSGVMLRLGISPQEIERALTSQLGGLQATPAPEEGTTAPEEGTTATEEAQLDDAPSDNYEFVSTEASDNTPAQPTTEPAAPRVTPLSAADNTTTSQSPLQPAVPAVLTTEQLAVQVSAVRLALSLGANANKAQNATFDQIDLRELNRLVRSMPPARFVQIIADLNSEIGASPHWRGYGVTTLHGYINRCGAELGLSDLRFLEGSLLLQGLAIPDIQLSGYLQLRLAAIRDLNELDQSFLSNAREAAARYASSTIGILNNGVRCTDARTVPLNRNAENDRNMQAFFQPPRTASAPFTQADMLALLLRPTTAPAPTVPTPAQNAELALRRTYGDPSRYVFADNIWTREPAPTGGVRVILDAPGSQTARADVVARLAADVDNRIVRCLSEASAPTEMHARGIMLYALALAPTVTREAPARAIDFRMLQQLRGRIDHQQFQGIINSIVVGDGADQIGIEALRNHIRGLPGAPGECAVLLFNRIYDRIERIPDSDFDRLLNSVSNLSRQSAQSDQNFQQIAAPAVALHWRLSVLAGQYNTAVQTYYGNSRTPPVDPTAAQLDAYSRAVHIHNEITRGEGLLRDFNQRLLPYGALPTPEGYVFNQDLIALPAAPPMVLVTYRNNHSPYAYATARGSMPISMTRIETPYSPSSLTNTETNSLRNLALVLPTAVSVSRAAIVTGLEVELLSQLNSIAPIEQIVSDRQRIEHALNLSGNLGSLRDLVHQLAANRTINSAWADDFRVRSSVNFVNLNTIISEIGSQRFEAARIGINFGGASLSSLGLQTLNFEGYIRLCGGSLSQVSDWALVQHIITQNGIAPEFVTGYLNIRAGLQNGVNQVNDVTAETRRRAVYSAQISYNQALESLLEVSTWYSAGGGEWRTRYAAANAAWSQLNIAQVSSYNCAPNEDIFQNGQWTTRARQVPILRESVSRELYSHFRRLNQAGSLVWQDHQIRGFFREQRELLGRCPPPVQEQLLQLSGGTRDLLVRDGQAGLAAFLRGDQVELTRALNAYFDRLTRLLDRRQSGSIAAGLEAARTVVDNAQRSLNADNVRLDRIIRICDTTVVVLQTARTVVLATGAVVATGGLATPALTSLLLFSGVAAASHGVEAVTSVAIGTRTRGQAWTQARVGLTGDVIEIAKSLLITRAFLLIVKVGSIPVVSLYRTFCVTPVGQLARGAFSTLLHPIRAFNNSTVVRQLTREIVSAVRNPLQYLNSSNLLQVVNTGTGEVVKVVRVVASGPQLRSFFINGVEYHTRIFPLFWGGGAAGAMSPLEAFLRGLAGKGIEDELERRRRQNNNDGVPPAPARGTPTLVPPVSVPTASPTFISAASASAVSTQTTLDPTFTLVVSSGDPTPPVIPSHTTGAFINLVPSPPPPPPPPPPPADNNGAVYGNYGGMFDKFTFGNNLNTGGIFTTSQPPQFIAAPPFNPPPSSPSIVVAQAPADRGPGSGAGLTPIANGDGSRNGNSYTAALMREPVRIRSEPSDNGSPPSIIVTMPTSLAQTPANLDTSNVVVSIAQASHTEQLGQPTSMQRSIIQVQPQTVLSIAVVNQIAQEHNVSSNATAMPSVLQVAQTMPMTMPMTMGQSNNMQSFSIQAEPQMVTQLQMVASVEQRSPAPPRMLSKVHTEATMTASVALVKPPLALLEVQEAKLVSMRHKQASDNKQASHNKQGSDTARLATYNAIRPLEHGVTGVEGIDGDAATGDAAHNKKRAALQRRSKEGDLRLREIVIHQLLTTTMEHTKRARLLRLLISLKISESDYRELVAKLGEAEVEAMAAGMQEKLSVARSVVVEVDKEQPSASSERPATSSYNKVSRAELYVRLKQSELEVARGSKDDLEH